MKNNFIVTLSLCLILTICFVGCNSQEDPTEPPKNTEETDSTENVLIQPLPWKYSIYDVYIQNFSSDKVASFDVIEPFFEYSSVNDDFNAQNIVTIQLTSNVVENQEGTKRLVKKSYSVTGELIGISYDALTNKTPRLKYRVTSENEAKIVEFHLDEYGRIIYIETDEQALREECSGSIKEKTDVHEVEEILKEFVTDNISNYVDLTDFKVSEYSSDGVPPGPLLDMANDRPYIEYTKEIDGFVTPDSFRVNFLQYGMLLRFESTMLGRVEAEVDMSKVDMNKVKDTLNKAIDTVYEGRDGYARINNKILFLGIYILDDGSLGAYYHVNVNLKPENADKQTEEHYVLVNITPYPR